MWVIIPIVIYALLALCWIFIWGKAGYNKWFGLLMIVPVVNVIAFLVFAFEDWPIEGRPHDDTKCPSCGATIANDWIVCPHCQERLRRDCPQCGKTIKAGWKSCPFCATPIHNTDDLPIVQVPYQTLTTKYPCPQCSKPVAYDAGRCPNCGERLFEIDRSK